MDVADVLRQRLREVRDRKGWSQRDLAARMAEAGVPLDPASVARIETGKRQVKVTEMVALAAVLEVSPIYLVLPITKKKQVNVTPETSVTTEDAREWWRGFTPLPGQDRETLDSERGDDPTAKLIDELEHELEAAREQRRESAQMLATAEALLKHMSNDKEDE